MLRFKDFKKQGFKPLLMKELKNEGMNRNVLLYKSLTNQLMPSN